MRLATSGSGVRRPRRASSSSSSLVIIIFLLLVSASCFSYVLLRAFSYSASSSSSSSSSPPLPPLPPSAYRSQLFLQQQQYEPPPQKRVLLSELTPLTQEEKEVFFSRDQPALQRAVDELTIGHQHAKLSLLRKASQNQQGLIQRLADGNAMQRVLLRMLSRGSLYSASDVAFEARVLAGRTEAEQERVTYRMAMDTENLWRPIPGDILANLERQGGNPLNNNCSAGNTLLVADHKGKYAGLTSDMGWVLMNSMYALETGNCAELPSEWGHGCDNGEDDDEAASSAAGWTCFFKPIQRKEEVLQQQQPRRQMSSLAQEMRRTVRRDELYTGGFTGHRYPRLKHHVDRANLFPDQHADFAVRENADLLAFRLVFRWTFQVKDSLRARIDALQLDALQGYKPEEIAGAHLRFGDKLGLQPGPKEAHLKYTSRDFAERLVLHYKERQMPLPKALFVATDDFAASQQLSDYLHGDIKVLTTALPDRDKGFSIVEYRKEQVTRPKDKFDSAVRLWADMEILARTEVFLGSFQSNVARMVHLMRFDKPAGSTINVDPTRTPRCSKSQRVNQLATHNFWYCP